MMDPRWVIAGVVLWIGFGLVALILYWLTWRALSAYFVEMQAVPFVDRQACGWPSENPLKVTFGLGATWARSRLMMRLLVFGAPPLAHSPAALAQLRRYRRWALVGVVLGIIPMLALSYFSLFFLVFFAVGLLLNWLILRPKPWPEGQI